ncbi:MFS transporter, partial [Streptomyces lividans]
MSARAAARTGGLLDEGVAAVTATAEGCQLAFRVAAVVATGALGLAAVVLRRRAGARGRPGRDISSRAARPHASSRAARAHASSRA